jgi:UDP:flavonoid glycosyltransferase YjiC (YdhE family)
MITTACAQLGERALICAAGTDFGDVADLDDHVRVVDTMNYGANLPGCRAFAHHGGAGTTNAGLRAGLPTLVLWTLPDQAAWGSRIKRLKIGTGRRFSATTPESLVADLRTVLAPECLTRARALAAQMTQPEDSIATAADVLEKFARLKRVG